MRNYLFAVVLVAAASPAIACVCVGPLTAEQQLEAAQRIAEQAAAVADVELATPMDQAAMRGETYRILQVHVGNAPAQFELDRGFSRGPSGDVQTVMTSCDIIPPAGERTTVILYSTSMPGRYRIGGTCDHLFITSPGAVDLVREAARKLARRTERG